MDFGRIGILTCYDGWFPETFRVLSLKGAELLVWINGRRGTVEDFIVKSAMFQNEVAMISTNQAYGAGTMIGQWPAQILASCPEPKENYITATINLEQVRQARKEQPKLGTALIASALHARWQAALGSLLPCLLPSFPSPVDVHLHRLLPCLLPPLFFRALDFARVRRYRVGT